MKQIATATSAAPRWASYAEIEKIYGLSRWTTWRLLKNYDIRAARVGRNVRIDCLSVEKYLEQQVEDFA